MPDINLRQFDLNLLKAFDMLDRERNVTEAARRLGLGQPAMSHALARLREQFDDKLFVRGGNGMVPTPKATELIGPLRLALAQIESALMLHAPADTRVTTKRFRIGMSDVIASAVTARLSEALARQATDASLAVVSADRSDAPAMLDAGELDLAIGLFPAPPAWHDRQVLFEEDFVCAFHPRLINATSPISIEDFVLHPHVLVTRKGNDRGFVDAALDKAKLKRRISVTTQFFLLAGQIINQLPLIATLPRHYAEHFANSAGATLSELPFPSPHMTISVIWHKRNDGNPASLMLRKLLGKAFSGA
jgi:LysR family transcriptional regulator, mexEF-oprN operon transcriptional activator